MVLEWTALKRRPHPMNAICGKVYSGEAFRGHKEVVGIPATSTNRTEWLM
jgi:hypothetical protein